MLFFAPPRTLVAWLRQPSGEIFMQQRGDALVADRRDLGSRLGLDLLPGVNSGLLGLDDSAFDWSSLERAAGAFTAAEREHHWAEQTLFAVHVSRRQAAPLSPVDYYLCHGRGDFRAPASLRHYIHKSKALYLATEWRLWLDHSRSAPAAG